MDKERVRNYMEQAGIGLTDSQAAAFVRYYELLVEWNSFMNLTAITDAEEVLIKHFADSCAPGFRTAAAAPAGQGPVFPEDKKARLLDVGSGAGFPAIPLKIAFPDLRITMLDSLGKRGNFLNEVISELGLKEITALHGRAEDLARDPEHRETYDYVVSRAVANMNTLSEYCLPFVKEGGYFLAYKSLEYLSGGEREGSEKAIGLLGGRTVEVRQINLPEWDAKRCLVFIRKESPTPKKFPRKAGLPSKEPL